MKISGLNLFFCEDFQGVTEWSTECTKCETITPSPREYGINNSLDIDGNKNFDKINDPQKFIFFFEVIS